MNDPLLLTEQDFTLFQKLLIEESGIYFDKDRNKTLSTVLCDRIQNLKLESYYDYYVFLKSSYEGKQELKKLLDLITIGETYFFRNTPQFDALMKFVLPEIIKNKNNSIHKSIRIWSAGSSKGDEAYSIAIAIMETLHDYENWDISILGTDINRDVLNEAREAIYIEKDIEHLPKEYLIKYFNKINGRYLLNDNVKKLVTFEYHNLAKDMFIMNKMINLDIIFCRNVTIYFNLETTKKIIDNFYNCLSKNGYLFIGHSETLWKLTNKFEIIEFAQTFVYKKAHQIIAEKNKSSFAYIPEINLKDIIPSKNKCEKINPAEKPKNSQTDEIVNCESLCKKATRFFLEKKYENALTLFNNIIEKDKNYVQAYYGKATILANQAKYDEAIIVLKKAIELDNLYLDAYYLLGVLLYKIGNFKEAEQYFKKVIYIDPEIALAYFNLGNLYLQEREIGKAIKQFNNAIRLLNISERNKPLKFGEDFNIDLLLNSCKNKLAEIDSVK
ncbi:tetratricopeptide repeat protein [Candidatus Poribacteria bacterium]|nr:tetratricopeptide repeat protein [Candidatus Poribacteria bacterium]